MGIKPSAVRSSKHLIPSLSSLITESAITPIPFYKDAMYGRDPYETIAFSKIGTYLSEHPGSELFRTQPAFANFAVFKKYLLTLDKHFATLLIKLGGENAENKLLTKSPLTDPAHLEEVRLGVQEYVRLLEDTQDLPFWHNKVKTELGQVVAQLQIMHEGTPELEEVFAQVNKQDLFK